MKPASVLFVLGMGCLLSGAPAFAEEANPAPVCVGIGTRSEGWSSNGRFLRYDHCKDKVLVCRAKGTRSENYAAAEVISSRLLGYANCSAENAVQPRCGAIGTRSEGWVGLGARIYDHCAGKITQCVGVGTRSEGWVALELGEAQFLTYARCAALRSIDLGRE